MQSSLVIFFFFCQMHVQNRYHFCSLELHVYICVFETFNIFPYCYYFSIHQHSSILVAENRR